MQSYNLISIIESLLNEASYFNSEYWIQDDYVQMADSNIDMGHEAYAIQHAALLVLSKLDIYKDEAYIGDMDSEIYEAIEDNLPEDKKSEYNNNDISMVELLIWYGENVLKNPEFKELVSVAYDLSKSDPRRYAMKNWGWKAIRGNEIDTWNLTPSDLSIISRGIGDAYESEIEEYESEHSDIDEHGYKGPYFSIEVYSKQDYYKDIPLSVIDSGNFSEMRKYKLVNNGQRIMEREALE